MRVLHPQDLLTQPGRAPAAAAHEPFAPPLSAASRFSDVSGLRPQVCRLPAQRDLLVGWTARHRLVEQERYLMWLEPVDTGEMPVREDGAAFDEGGGAVI